MSNEDEFAVVAVLHVCTLFALVWEGWYGAGVEWKGVSFENNPVSRTGNGGLAGVVDDDGDAR